MHTSFVAACKMALYSLGGLVLRSAWYMAKRNWGVLMALVTFALAINDSSCRNIKAFSEILSSHCLDVRCCWQRACRSCRFNLYMPSLSILGLSSDFLLRLPHGRISSSGNNLDVKCFVPISSRARISAGYVNKSRVYEYEWHIFGVVSTRGF